MSTKSKTEVYTEQSRSGAKKRSFYILTFGCQMNMYDSNIMASLLEQQGYKKTDNIDDTDVIIVNTCSVRQHAVRRALTRLESLKVLKKKKPHIRIGVTGCIPQQLKESLINQKPYIDFILGPDNLRKISSCMESENGAFLQFSKSSVYSDLSPARGDSPEAFVSVMRGCNNFCSYCVVPYTRGMEKSRNIDDILHELRKLSKRGYKRVVLLGQNVNNYNDRGKGLSHLLSLTASIDGIERIGFLTSHPAYFPLDVIDVMKHEPKVEKYLHLPLQSGNSDVLRRMKRGYTKEEYLNIIDKAREAIKDIALSTDIIVGFPGETDNEYQETIEVVQQTGFDFAYMFKYSPRKYTLANTFPDNIPENDKKQRLNDLIQIQNEMSRQKSNTYKGKVLEVLVTGRNRKNYLESDAISVYNKRVIVEGRLTKGTMLKIKLDEVKGWTPIGRPIEHTVSSKEWAEDDLKKH